MKITKGIYLAVLAVLLSPMAANADLIAYNFEGASDPIWADRGLGDWTLSVEVLFDEADVLPNVDIGSSILSWSAAWTNDTQSFAVGSELGGTLLFDSFFVGPDLSVQIQGMNLCSSPCGVSAPTFLVFDNGSGAFRWAASYLATGCCVNGDGVWSGPSSASVPEPGTMALFGIGLAGMGLARRRRKA